MLEPILQQVGAGNPQLAQMIASHPEQFLQLLAEDADEDAPLPPGAQAISVTEEEREAIERVRLISMQCQVWTNTHSCAVSASSVIL
jgi:UV excision repair protein RAD23